MNNQNLKKWIIPNLPYILFVYLFDKAAQAVRLAPGADLSGKLLGIGNGFTSAFASPLPSFSPVDMLIGIAGAILIRLIVYTKGKNAKKYRKGVEYGSARWIATQRKFYTRHSFRQAKPVIFVLYAMKRSIPAMTLNGTSSKKRMLSF